MESDLGGKWIARRRRGKQKPIISTNIGIWRWYYESYLSEKISLVKKLYKEQDILEAHVLYLLATYLKFQKPLLLHLKFPRLCVATKCRN